jgi:transcriptional regulator with XRE-family HTH domain
MTIRAAVEKERKRQGMSMYRLAKVSGVSYGRLHPFLTGRKRDDGTPVRLETDNLEKVMRALRLELSPKRARGSK